MKVSIIASIADADGRKKMTTKCARLKLWIYWLSIPVLAYAIWTWLIPFLCCAYGFFMAGAYMEGWWGL